MNTLVSLQNYINKILTKKFNISVTVYLNNIFINIKALGQNYIIVIY